LAADQHADVEVNVLNFLFTGEVRDRAFEGLAVYLDDVRIDVRVDTTNDAQTRVVGVLNPAGQPEAMGGPGQEIWQRAEQQLDLAVDLLAFEFSGTFGDDAFRGADFHFSRIGLDLSMDVRNAVGLMAAGDEAGGDIAQGLDQQDGATFGLLNARFDDTYQGDDFKDAEFHIADISLGMHVTAANGALLWAGEEQRIETAGGIPPPEITCAAPTDAWLELA
jgi:hypothetical protein